MNENKTKSYTKLFFVITAAITIGLFSSLSLSQVEIKPLKVEEEKLPLDYKNFLQSVIDKVKTDYVDVKTDKQIAEAAASGILSSLDPHSSYLDEDGLKELSVQTKGEFGGVGIEITLEYSVVKVVTAIEDTPAFQVGIKSGDYITKVDGKSIAGLSIEEVVKRLRGKPNTKVNVTILRKGEKEPLQKTITRQIIKVKAVKSSLINDIAYIKITTFSEQTYANLVTHLEELKTKLGEKKLKGLVLDLRNNPGGLLDQAVKVSDAFLAKGRTIVSMSGRDKTQAKYFKDESDEALIPNLPMAVLINEGSASASEIVAGALQENRRAVIMGNKSFGKGSVQTILPISKGYGALRLTTALYYTPSGRSIQANGIEPDITLTDAKIEKQNKPSEKDSEASLRNHIEQQVNDDAIAGGEKIEDSNFELYQQDYQLARAVDLVRGMSVYNSSISPLDTIKSDAVKK